MKLMLNDCITVKFNEAGINRYKEYLSNNRFANFTQDEISSFFKEDSVKMTLISLLQFISKQRELPYYMFIKEIEI